MCSMFVAREPLSTYMYQCISILDEIIRGRNEACNVWTYDRLSPTALYCSYYPYHACHTFPLWSFYIHRFISGKLLSIACGWNIIQSNTTINNTEYIWIYSLTFIHIIEYLCYTFATTPTNTVVLLVSHEQLMSIHRPLHCCIQYTGTAIIYITHQDGTVNWLSLIVRVRYGIIYLTHHSCHLDYFLLPQAALHSVNNLCMS